NYNTNSSTTRTRPMNAQTARFPNRKFAALVPQALILALAVALAGCSSGDEKDAATDKGSKDKQEQVAKEEGKSEGKGEEKGKDEVRLGKDGKPEKEIKPV